MGNAKALQTHAPLSQTAESLAGKCPSLDPNWPRVAIEVRKAEQRRKGEPDTGAGWSRTFEGTGIMLRHRGVTTPSNPLWIMAVSTSLIPDHSGIANPLLLCFFDSLLGDPKTINPQAERFQEERKR